MLNVIIVDDELPARENLRCLLQNDPEITIVAECQNAMEAIREIHRLQPDVVFLDIQMPKINGIEMLSMLDPDTMPHIVFLTAYSEFAVKAFEEQAFDYLLKPVEQGRLNKTLTRLHQQCPSNIEQLASIEQEFNYIPCVGHNRIYLLNMDDVFYIASKVSGIYVFNHENSAYFTELTLKTLEDKTPLIRCHRQYLINPKKLKEIRFNDAGGVDIILINDISVPVSRRYLKPFKETIGL
ncbi:MULTISPECIES: two-component system response regulator BtsR [unclassified Gilliamella]|uniref:two-component system response regulator BtsR n=1 Tax=unclassified Gilliamella TaxID=2685620 RepID=UPI001C6A7EBB|nr:MULTISPECIES: two-component system response regulator BtsR [unclassified Gilliamella]MCX8600621.1 two-component system response regulator BtsR [Gilliamella sp. B3722]MCX8609161.1 two-component system response regulator BtsR [Gilliamella sp. B3771]MCX8609838.1 two-component system response regulator BtsR [Gilliamella sp. B3891]MCX8612072.1 two-component system response regulator BtsR [Gilliamella sp. B3773]MCX8615576.1 two-component system response regulator BtsR [Gilliamella sp. B3770]